MRAFVLAASALLLIPAAVFSSQPVKFDKSQLVDGEIPKQYWPENPRSEAGTGVYILRIDSKTGEVKSITIQKSAGHKRLDAAVLKACVHWRFKPHTVEEVRFQMAWVGIPIRILWQQTNLTNR